VTDLGGTTAASLNIAGTATANTIDGAEEKSITVTSTDTLASLQSKINQASFGVTASIVNDGSASSPYRLSLTSINSGANGRVLIDPGSTGLSFSNLVNGQDAAVFYGGGGTSQPLLITSSSNQLTNVIKGVTVNLTAATNTPVTLNVTPSPSGVESQLTSFVTAFNSLNTTIDTDTQFDTTTDQGGLLLGDATTQTISQTVYNLLNTTVTGGPYKSLADIGITISANGSLNSPTLNFDQSTFEAAFAANPTAVSNLFTQATTGLGTAMQNAMSQLIDPVNGVVTLENQTLTTQTTQYQNQITELNAILAEKQTQLQNEFNNMETTLASLQNQQSILNSWAGIKPATTSSGSSSSSSSSGSSSTTSGG
jgi:flagellar hook-associated protein 2